MYILLAICVIVLAIFGVASFMDSYATAKQAQATIEVAQVAQVNAWGNLIVILVLALMILLVAAAIVWMVVKRSGVGGQRRAYLHERAARQANPIVPAQGADLNTVVTLMAIKMMSDLGGRNLPSPRPSPLQGEGDEAEAEPFHWLRSG